MFQKQDVRFPVEGGIELSAWLFVPEHHNAPLPAITMARALTVSPERTNAAFLITPSPPEHAIFVAGPTYHR